MRSFGSRTRGFQPFMLNISIYGSSLPSVWFRTCFEVPQCRCQAPGQDLWTGLVRRYLRAGADTGKSVGPMTIWIHFLSDMNVNDNSFANTGALLHSLPNHAPVCSVMMITTITLRRFAIHKASELQRTPCGFGRGWIPSRLHVSRQKIELRNGWSISPGWQPNS